MGGGIKGPPSPPQLGSRLQGEGLLLARGNPLCQCHLEWGWGGGVVWTKFWLAVSGFPNAVAFLSPPVRCADCPGGEPVLGSPDLRVLVDGKMVEVRQRYRQAQERPSRVHARDSRGIQSSASAVLQNKGPPSSQVSRFCPRVSTGGRVPWQPFCLPGRLQWKLC